MSDCKNIAQNQAQSISLMSTILYIVRFSISYTQARSHFHKSCGELYLLVRVNMHTLQSRIGKYRGLQGNPNNENRIPAMTGFLVMQINVFYVFNNESSKSIKSYGKI